LSSRDFFAIHCPLEAFAVSDFRWAVQNSPIERSSFVTSKRALGNMTTTAFITLLPCEPGRGRAASMNLMARRLQYRESGWSAALLFNSPPRVAEARRNGIARHICMA
jgi:hypothetical protein